MNTDTTIASLVNQLNPFTQQEEEVELTRELSNPEAGDEIKVSRSNIKRD